MSDLKPRGVAIVLDGVERHLLFTLNAIDEIQENFGKPLGEVIGEITSGDPSNKRLQEVTAILLNNEAERVNRHEGAEKFPQVTVQEVGDMIGLDNLLEVTKALLRAYGISIPEPEDESPNQTGGQQNS